MAQQWQFYMATARDQKNRRLLKLVQDLIRGLNLSQIILAVCLLLCGGTGLAVSLICRLPIYLYGSGVWVGLICTLTSILGLTSVSISKARRCLTVTHFVLNIISLILAATLSVASGFWLCESWITVQKRKPCGECFGWDAITAFVMSTCMQMFLAAGFGNENETRFASVNN